MSNLFPDDPAAAPALTAEEKLHATYAELLLFSPPVRSLSPEFEPDANARRVNANRLAAKDCKRFRKALEIAGLRLVDEEGSAK